jgi:hypothetical protein
MNKPCITLALLLGLSGCGLISTQAVYQEISAQENAKSVGGGAAPSNKLPTYDQYQKVRSGLSPEIK